MKSIIPALIACACLSLPAPAQQAPGQPSSAKEAANPSDGKSEFATVDGIAVGSGGQPLRKTTVTLRPVDSLPIAGSVIGGSPAAARPGTLVTNSDAAGKFHFERVPPGRYTLSGEHIGYLRTSYGSKRQFSMGTVIALTAGKTLADVTLEMMPAAVIAGKVLDEDGDPIPRAQIRLARLMYRNGKKQMLMASMNATDSAGEFRLDNIAPGKYLLCATKRPIFFMGDAPARDASLKPGEQEQDYVTTYYPGVTEESAAEQITATGGQDLLGLNITLRKMPVFHVRGKVVGMIPGKPLSTLRVAASEADSPMGLVMFGGPGSSNIAKDGSFELSSLRTGSYTVNVTTSSGMIQTLSKQRVQVGNQDLNDVTISLQPLAEVTGSLELEGEQQEDTAAAQAKSQGKNADPLPAIRVMLSSVEQMPIGMPPQPLKEDGSFSFSEVASGKYRLNVMGLPAGGYLSGVRLGGQDALNDGFEVNSGQVKLDVRISLKGGQLSGSVSDGANPAGGALVTLLPEPPNPERNWLYRNVTADQNGDFNLKGIAPGKYRLYAWEDIEPGAEQDPDFTKPWTGKSAEVTVKEKSNETAALVRISKADLAARQ